MLSDGDDERPNDHELISFARGIRSNLDPKVNIFKSTSSASVFTLLILVSVSILALIWKLVDQI